jgi:hypothetical protein
MAELAALSGLITFVIGLTLLIVFFVMATNIGTMVKILRRMEAQSQSIKISLDKLANTIPNEKSKSMTVEEKAKAYDQKS